MNASFEAHRQLQTERRRRIIKLMLFVVLGIVLVLVGLWFWVTQPLSAGSQPVVTTSIDPARLERHVRILSTELSPRDESHPENLDRAADYIRAQFESAGAVVKEQPYHVGQNKYRNVVAAFGAETQSRVIVGAHYDTAGPFPGADDNASGVAGLIELAYSLGKQQLPVRIELVAYTLEEPPYFRSKYMGSNVHAVALRKEGADVKIMICLEMIGYFSDDPESQKFPAPFLGALYSSKGNFIAVVGRFGDGLLVRRIKSRMRGATPLPVYSINAPTVVPGVDFSDQLNYWNVGYDAVMITDTAFFRNPNYHTAQDTADTLDYKRMAMVVEGVYAAILAEKQ